MADSDDSIGDIKKYTQSLMDQLKDAFLTNFNVDAIKQKLFRNDKIST